MAHDRKHGARSYESLLAAAERGEPSAVEALKQFIRLKSAERPIVIECHPVHGWRVREPFARD